MRALLILVGALTGTSLSATARAESKDADWDADVPVTKASRRWDFTLGASGGLNLGRARGYPNEVDKIGDRDYRADTKNAVGAGGALWAGVTFTDWLTFALGAATIELASGDLSASGGGFLARVETFPLFYSGGAWRDLGVSANFGLGFLKIEGDGEEKADGGSMSLVGVGVFHEPLRLGHFVLGPMVEYTHLFSKSANAGSTVLGARLALYTGPG